MSDREALSWQTGRFARGDPLISKVAGLLWRIAQRPACQTQQAHDAEYATIPTENWASGASHPVPGASAAAGQITISMTCRPMYSGHKVLERSRLRVLQGGCNGRCLRSVVEP